jgi:CRISPR-associated protein Cas1
LRELRIPTVRDRIVQQALLNVLTPLIDPIFSPCSFAYRPNLSYINAVEKIAYWRDNGYQFVLDGDIVKFFDNLNHQCLFFELRKLINHPGILYLIKSWVTCGILTKNGLEVNTKGVPQGAVISPLLANIYLDAFDKVLSNSDLKLVRYADDFVVLANSQERIITAYPQVVEILKAIKLELHPQKSQVTNFERGFRFLGHGFIQNAIFPLEDQPDSNNNKNYDKANLNGKKKSPPMEVKTHPSETQEEKEKVNKNQKLTPTYTGLNILRSVPNFEEINKYWNEEMATLYLMEQGTALAKDHYRFIVQVSKDQKLELPLNQVERILIFGNIHLTTPVINTCLQNKIIILFLTLSGLYRGHLWSEESIHLANHLVQFERRNDSLFQLNVSRAIVFGKLTNSRQLLMRLNRKRKQSDVTKAIAGINADIEALEKVDNIDTLRGYEGITAARYFPAFGQLITNSDFSFCLRNRQPPQDPVNSLLSFGYTLLFNNVLSLIIAEGLSPYLANFHYGEDKKPYLAFDLMEEFRSPIVDSLVIKIVNKSIVKPQDFEKVVSNGGIYLTGEGKKLFVKHFENRMNEAVSHPSQKSPVTYRQAIQLQIRRYKQSLLSSVPYEPFLRKS